MTDSRTPRRRWSSPVAVVLVLAVLGAVIGLGSAVVRGTVWTSESQLQWDPSVRAGIDPNYATPDSTTFDRQVADQSDVVLSDAVVTQAAESLDLPAAQVRAAIDVKTTSGSGVFQIDASASGAAEARRIATQVTNAYVDALQTANADQLQARLSALTPVIAELRRQLANANATAAGPLATNIAQLVSQQAEYQAASDDVPVEASVLRAAETPTAPSSLSAPVSLLIGAALGAVVAICLLLLLGNRAASAVRTLTPVRAEPSRPAVGAAPAAAVAAPAPSVRPAAPVVTAPAATAPAATARAAEVAPATTAASTRADESEPSEQERHAEPSSDEATPADDDETARTSGATTASAT